MEHLQIAYDLCVILIGLAALSIAAFWARRSGDVDLRNFCILYALFTFMMVVELLQKYLSLNVESYSARGWYALSGANQAASQAIVPGLLHYVLGASKARHAKGIVIGFISVSLICFGLIISPLGAVLHPSTRSIHLGLGFQIAAAWYYISFTIALVLTCRLLIQAWNTDQRSFTLGLTLFAGVGYAESLLNISQVFTQTDVTMGNGGGFLLSSIPFALYGIFLIHYFQRYPAEAAGIAQLSEDFVAKYGITEREREIIQKVIEGKSNARIAGELFISLATVKTHLHNIFKKIGAESRFELLAKVRSEG